MERQKTLLLVDDQHDELDLLQAILKSYGYKVLAAKNGYGALELFGSKPIDAVVLDYEMPIMSGGVVALEMRRANPLIPILMFSGCGSLPKSVLKSLDGFIPKGVRPGLLISALRRLFMPFEKLKPPRLGYSRRVTQRVSSLH